ncbi:MAG: hypothetical protein WA749_08945 [Gelidibacter sp.]
MTITTFDDSPIPIITNIINIKSKPMVTGSKGITSQMLRAYFTASLPEITVVAMYDSTDKEAASEAVDFLVVFNKAL